MNHDLQKQCNDFKFPNKALWSMYKTVKPTLNALIMFSDDKGDTFVSIDTLKKTVGCCVQTIVNHLKFLEENKLIIQVKSGKHVVRTVTFDHYNIITSSLLPSLQVPSTIITSSLLPSLQVPVTTGIEAKEVKKEKIREGLTAPLPSVVPLDHTAEAIEVAQYLKDAILELQPTAKTPSNISSWAKDIDKAIKIDDRSAEAMKGCIDWIFREDGKNQNFWKPNIRSGAKLREKYDQLELQAKGK